MTQTRGRDTAALKAVVHNVAKGLDPRAVAALAAHPDAVRSALAVAASTLFSRDMEGQGVDVIRGAEPRFVDAKEAARRLAAWAEPGKEEDLLTSDELAARAGLKTRQSVHNWRKQGKVIGWQGGKRGYVFPAGQFDDRGRPIAGLERVAVCFGDGYAAWVWLTTPRNVLDGATPLARLRKGEIDRVAAAAEGDAQGDFA